ncbi:MAG: VWA domain-containing protein [Brachymonas sp.]|nr:VWA domain-containing protein [Brachymonas sp.]
MHWPRTLAARGTQPLRREHLRGQDHNLLRAALHCFVLDCSASMLANGRLALAKGVLAHLLQQVYVQREQAVVLGFSGQGTKLLQPPARARPACTSQLAAPAWLASVAGGGGTPLADALAQADALLQRHSHRPRWLWLLSDGRSRAAPPRPAHAEHAYIIDFDTARLPLQRCLQLAQVWQAEYMHIHTGWQDSH